MDPTCSNLITIGSASLTRFLLEWQALWTTRASVTTNERSEKNSIFASLEEEKMMGETKVLDAEEDHKKSDGGEVID